jgi:hypothetical protein
MKFNQWWEEQQTVVCESVTNREVHPVVAYEAVRQMCFEAWQISAKQGRHNAGKGGRLFNSLKRIGLSNKRAGDINKAVLRLVLG